MSQKELIEQIKQGKKDLIGVHLEFANLQNLDLRWANLSFANLRYAHLNHANLQHANLHFDLVDGAFFTETDLSGANLEGMIGTADFSRANIHLARIEVKHKERLFPTARHAETAIWLTY